VLVPALQIQEDWGEIPREKAQIGLLDGVEKFLGSLNESILAMKDNVQLTKPERRFSVMDYSPAAITKAAGSSETVEQLEGALVLFVDAGHYIFDFFAFICFICRGLFLNMNAYQAWFMDGVVSLRKCWPRASSFGRRMTMLVRAPSWSTGKCEWPNSTGMWSFVRNCEDSDCFV
jgi:hypothetical protein